MYCINCGKATLETIDCIEENESFFCMSCGYEFDVSSTSVAEYGPHIGAVPEFKMLFSPVEVMLERYCNSMIESLGNSFFKSIPQPTSRQRTITFRRIQPEVN